MRESGVQFNTGYDFKSKWYVSPTNTADKAKYNHPTIKPLELVKRHILNTTKENEVVLDCFSGSGTTAVACKMLNRRFIGMEIDKKYYEISLKRLEEISPDDYDLFVQDKLF